MKPAAEGEAAVLLIEREGVHLQAAGQHHLHGPVVLHRAGGVDVHVGDRRGLPGVHTGGEWGKGETRGQNMRAVRLTF